MAPAVVFWLAMLLTMSERPLGDGAGELVAFGHRYKMVCHVLQPCELLHNQGRCMELWIVPRCDDSVIYLLRKGSRLAGARCMEWNDGTLFAFFDIEGNLPRPNFCGVSQASRHDPIRTCGSLEQPSNLNNCRFRCRQDHHACAQALPPCSDPPHHAKAQKS